LETGLSDELAQTITILHSYRNEVYHVGLRHESILLALSRFYFDVGCSFFESYKPRFLGWSSDSKIPERAKKYLGGGQHSASFDSLSKACQKMKTSCAFKPSEVVDALADDMDRVIEEQDYNVDLVSKGVYVGQQRKRDEAVRETQAWRLAFTEEGKAFGKEKGFNGSVLEAIEWLGKNYPLQYKKDPVPSWRAIATKLRAKKNAHIALSNYHSFMASTADIREMLEESAAAVDREIDHAIDVARGK
jgi:hypothetical protein